MPGRNLVAVKDAQLNQIKILLKDKDEVIQRQAAEIESLREKSQSVHSTV